MSNRLANSTSPYLLQHAENPVDWYPWSEEAFERAKREEKPIFLSVGYSACHWCHVMEHESFEKDDVAEILNREFVSIKVDREERPDVDEIYMTATQILTGSGGWPNSVFLTPEKKPFYAGTYFPPDDRWGRPGFKSVLTQLAKAWKERREDVTRQSEEIVRGMQASSSGRQVSVKPLSALSRGIVADAIADLERTFDPDHGGFGDAPKFPPHSALDLLVYEYPRSNNPAHLKMLTETLDAMARGGIHDHVGGGFARYSTDREWLVPHFEKMLYDNAQLSKVYVDAWSLTGHEEYRRAAAGIFEWVLREMTAPNGGFYSALDADSEGEEGKFYLWTKNEILDLLGARAEDFCEAFNISEKGNFIDPHVGHYDGRNIPHLHKPTSGFDTELRILRSHREKRVRPGLDNKILASWNGLMIESFARAGRILSEPRYTEAAERAADAALPHACAPMRFLDDYVFMAAGLIELERFDRAAQLMDEVSARFSEEAPGFYFTPHDHEEMLYRWKDPFDKAIPSGNGKAVAVLLRLGKIETAQGILMAYGEMMRRAARAMHSMILGLALYFDEYDAKVPKAVSKPILEITPKALGGSVEFALELQEGCKFNERPSLRMEHHPAAKLLNVDYRNPEKILAEVEFSESCEVKFHLSYQLCDDRVCHEPTSQAVVVGLKK